MKRSLLRPSIILLVFLLSVFLSSYSSEASYHYKSKHLKRKLHHTKRLREHGRGHKGRSQNHRSSRDVNFFLNEQSAYKITDDKKSGQVKIFPGSERKSRKKRAVFAWPPDTLFITEFSMEMPLYAPDGVGIPFTVEVPYEFDMPNITLFGGGAATGESETRSTSTKERLNFYSAVESLFSRFGFDGHSCMLKAVCERAETDILTHGLLGEVLTLILAASSTSTESNDLMEYMDAEFHGKSIGDCNEKYPKCPISVFHFFDS